MKKTKLLILIVLPAIFITLIAGIFTSNISPYVSVTELKTGNMVNRNVQVYGKVLIDSVNFDKQSGMLTFELTDGDNNVQIRHRGIVNNLQNASEVVAIGEYRDGVFHAEKVLVKCPSKYQEAERKEG